MREYSPQVARSSTNIDPSIICDSLQCCGHSDRKGKDLLQYDQAVTSSYIDDDHPTNTGDNLYEGNHGGIDSQTVIICTCQKGVYC